MQHRAAYAVLLVLAVLATPAVAPAASTGPSPLVVSATADAPTAPPGGTDGYTIRIDNPNTFDVSLASVTDVLPAGFSYIPGSSSGLSNFDPFISASQLQWQAGDFGFVVPANGFAKQSLKVKVASALGTYFTNATAQTQQGIGVTPSGSTAPITISAEPLEVSKYASPSSIIVRGQATWFVYIYNPNSISVRLTTIGDDLPADFSYVLGTTSGVTSADPTITGQHLQWSFPSGVSVPSNEYLFLQYDTIVSATPGDYQNVITAVPADKRIKPSSSLDTDTGWISVFDIPTITKVADSPSAPVHTTDGYTITIANPNAYDAFFTRIVDDLPSGFSYIPGTTSGETTSDPTVVGQTLTWNATSGDPFDVPPNGLISLHFNVVVSSSPGSYFNQAQACIHRRQTDGNIEGGGQDFCIETGATARIDVFADPVVTTKTADEPEAFVAEGDGYTITLTNPNDVAVTLDAIADHLPDGFSYVTGSTTGVTLLDPAVSGTDLLWDGPFTVPANDAISLHFSVIVSGVPGGYDNEASGVIGGREKRFSVTPTGPTARITVITRPLITRKTADVPDVRPNVDDGYTITIANPNHVSVALTDIIDTLPQGFSYLPGTTSGATTNDPDVSDLVLDWQGEFDVPAEGSISIHFGVRVAARPGTYFNRATGVPGDPRFPVTPTGFTARIHIRGTTGLYAYPAIADVGPDARVYFPELRAELFEDDTGRPIEGRRIVFSLGSDIVCQADTDLHGVAACGGLVQEINAVLALGYHASFAGDADYFGANDDGHLVKVLGSELP